MRQLIRFLAVLGTVMAVMGLTASVALAHSPTGDAKVAEHSPAGPNLGGLVTAIGNGADLSTAVGKIETLQPNCPAYGGHDEP